MINKEIKELIENNKSAVFALEPNTKSNITKSTIDNAVRDANRHLASKKRVWMILVKE